MITEASLAFAFPCLLLATGILVYLGGLMVAASIGELGQFLRDSVLVGPEFLFLLATGSIGLLGLFLLVVNLLDDQPPRFVGFIRVALLSGSLSLMVGAWELRVLAEGISHWWIIALAFPLLVSAHLVYLGRGFLWPGTVSSTRA